MPDGGCSCCLVVLLILGAAGAFVIWLTGVLFHFALIVAGLFLLFCFLSAVLKALGGKDS